MQTPQAAKKTERAGSLADAKREVSSLAGRVLAKVAGAATGLGSQLAALKPKGVAPATAPKIGGQPEPAPEPKKDPAVNPNTESEHVKGASYEAIKGQPFVKGSTDDKDIAANDVTQGQLGDCYFVAALAAIAHRSPETLRQRVKDHGNGTYTVSFHEGGDVVVDNRFPVKGGSVQFAAKGDEGATEGAELWVMLIEKAWAKLKGGYEEIRGNKIKMSSTDAMQAITGKETREIKDHAAMGDEELVQVLQDAQDQGWPVTLGVKNLTDEAEIKACRAAGLSKNHAFAVLEVDKAGKSVKVHNPWGVEYAATVSVDAIKKYVRQIQINKD